MNPQKTKDTPYLALTGEPRGVFSSNNASKYKSYQNQLDGGTI